MLLAAAAGEQPISTVIPEGLLREHRHELRAQGLFAVANLPDKLREGVYCTARAQ